MNNLTDFKKLLTPDQEDQFDEQTLEDLDTYLELEEALWTNWPMIYEVLLGHQVKFFHREWVDFQLENKWTILLGPRFFGKTQTCVKDLAILKSLKSRDERILILGKTLPQARSILREVRFQLERNSLIQIFGKFFDSKLEKTERSQTELFFVGRKKIFSEPNVSALGIGGSLLSRHFSTILCDDLVDSSNAQGRGAELLIQYLKEEVMPMVLPKGELHIIGASFGNKDLYHTLIKESQEGAENFEFKISSAEDANRESIWPEWISTKELRRLERRMGTPFYRAQLLNDTSMLDRKRKLFFEEDVQRRPRVEVMRKIEKIVVGIDPSTGEAANWTGMCTVARIKETPDWPRIWILDQFKEKYGSDESEVLLKGIQKKYRKFGIEAFVVEAFGMQADFANRLSRDLPVEKIYPSGSKVSRHNQAGILFQQGSVGVVNEAWEEMEDFWNYPDADSVDLIDSFVDAYLYLGEDEEEGDYEEIDMRSKEEQQRDKYRKDYFEKFGIRF